MGRPAQVSTRSISGGPVPDGIRVGPRAGQLLDRYGVRAKDLVDRHRAGDWGEVQPAIREANERAAARGMLITSRYRLADFAEVWVITGGDRQFTAVVTPEDALSDTDTSRQTRP